MVQHVVETYHKINFNNTKILNVKNKKLFFFHLFFNIFNRLWDMGERNGKSNIVHDTIY